MTDIEQTIHELNEATARKDISAFVELLHPDAVWEHNLGAGSPEEGVYGEGSKSAGSSSASWRAGSTCVSLPLRYAS